MDPDEVLALMRSAPERYENLRAAMRYRGDGRLIREVYERFLRSEAGRDERRVPPDPGDMERPEPEGKFGWRTRVWYEGASREGGVRERIELELPEEVYPGGGVDIHAWDGRIVGFNGVDTVVSNRIGGGLPEDDPGWLWAAQDGYWSLYPLDPPNVASLDLRFWHPHGKSVTVEGRAECADREAVRLVCVMEEDWDYDPDPLQWGADRYELLVDVERGVVLRVASMLRGEEIDSLEAEEIFFDEQFPEDVFTSPQPLPWR